MANFSVSTLGNQLFTTLNLQNQQTNLATLTEQLSSGKKYSDLTDYMPVEAHNVMDFQNAITQKQAYTSGITTVNSRLSMYDTTMNDMETIAQQASNLASQNQTFDSTKVAQIQAQAQSYLQQMQDDLNQKVSGRYVYAGSRYSTAPVSGLSALGAPTLPFTAATSPVLPDYDSGYSASALTFGISGQDVTIGGTPGTPQVATVTVGGTVYSYTVQSGDTTANIATGLATALTTGGITGSSATGSVLTVGGATAPSAASASVTSTAAYTKDSVTIDDANSLTYGVTSNDPGFQQVIAGLRLINAASSQSDPAVYQTYMQAASLLLSTGLNNVQATHAGVANNTNILTQQTTNLNADISNLQNQLGDLQQVDLTTVGTQINLLQTQLQASYSATASLLQESILKYL